jgi:hypothetical protein
MRYVYLVLTIALLCICFKALKLLDNPVILLLIFILVLLAGMLIKKNSKENKTLGDLGWGLFYGGSVALLMTFAFLIWLLFNFPK